MKRRVIFFFVIPLGIKTQGLIVLICRSIAEAAGRVKINAIIQCDTGT